MTEWLTHNAHDEQAWQLRIIVAAVTNATSITNVSNIKSHGAGSFGAMDPASHDLYMFLEKLQEQQKEVINLIKERQRIIAERDGTPLPAPPVFVPGGSPAPPLPAAALKEKALKEKTVSSACELHTQPKLRL